MIYIEDLTIKYGLKKALDKVTFNIEAGEFVSIVGPSAAGKSTLIHALIGKESIDGGKINIDHYKVEQLSQSALQDYRRQIGVVFQDYKLLSKKTVFENVAFALEVSGYEKSFISKRTVEVLKVVGLEEERNHFPHQLSGGERQRTAIARALVHAPRLLIADEPTGNLDPENAMALAQLLVKINEHGTTIILATHNKDIVNFLKKRVIALDHGKIISDKNQATYK